MFLCQSTAAPAAEDVAFAIVPFPQVTNLVCSREVPGHVSSGWDPTPALVAEAEARLPGFVSMNRTMNGYRRPPKPLDEYYRQYVGVVIGGERFIYVNLFPRSLAEGGWRTGYLLVCDGGAEYWSVLFDPKKLRFFSPRFNGPPSGG